MKYLTLLLVLFFPIESFSQSSSKLFEPGTISNNGLFGFALSPDGTHALWVNSKGKRDTLQINESIKVNGVWQTPRVVSFSGNPNWRDIDPVFSPDGNTVLFQSNRPVQEHPQRKRMDIWAARKTKNGWDEPYHMGNIINTDSSESYASITKRGDIYFTKENGSAKGDIFFSTFIKGQYQTPMSIGSPVNTDKRDANPFISPNGDYIIYAGEKENDSDLLISFRRDGKWSTPQNLGLEINSPDSEFCPFVHSRQDRLYFSQLKRSEARLIENTYYIDNISTIIKKLKATARF